MDCEVLVESISRGPAELTVVLGVRVVRGDPRAMTTLYIAFNSSMGMTAPIAEITMLENGSASITIDCEDPDGFEFFEMLNLVGDTLLLRVEER